MPEAAVVEGSAPVVTGLASRLEPVPGVGVCDSHRYEIPT
jgi:hypothetical protein